MPEIRLVWNSLTLPWGILCNGLDVIHLSQLLCLALELHPAGPVAFWKKGCSWSKGGWRDRLMKQLQRGTLLKPFSKPNMVPRGIPCLNHQERQFKSFRRTELKWSMKSCCHLRSWMAVLELLFIFWSPRLGKKRRYYRAGKDIESHELLSVWISSFVCKHDCFCFFI